MEDWKQFLDGYEVSNYGRIRKLPKLPKSEGWVRSGSKRSPKCKYAVIIINKQKYFIHELVATYFVKNSNYELFTKVQHLDGNYLNNHHKNLIWVHPTLIMKEDKTNWFKINKYFEVYVGKNPNEVKNLGMFHDEQAAKVAAQKWYYNRYGRMPNEVLH